MTAPSGSRHFPPDTPGFYVENQGYTWHSFSTRKTYQWVGERWVDVSDSAVFGDYCYSHMRREPRRPDLPSYKECPECFHVWFSKEEYVVDVRNQYYELGLPFRGLRDEDHYCCPLCTHDF